MPDEHGSELLPENGSKAWCVLDCRPAGSDAMIVYPYGDKQRHLGNNCWCAPRTKQRADGVWLFIHKAIDGRPNYQGTKINA